MAAPASGQDWNGSVSNLWFTGANWTPNTVPNSAAAAVSITNATNNPVLIDGAPTISTLTLGALNSLNLNNGESLTVAGPTIANNGNILIQFFRQFHRCDS